MQAYDRAFARIYNERWAYFAEGVAPHIQAFYEEMILGAEHKSLLDVCCGTGQLAVHFLERGYHVVGLDLSEEMLHYARRNTARYVESGQARFFRADAADFSLEERFGLAVSTYDALNHLPDPSALRACFQCVHAALLPGGTFIFDLNTRHGLRTHWNGVQVQDTEELLLVNRDFYDEEADKAWVKITSFVRTPDARVGRASEAREEGALYERFEQVAYNTAFDLEEVRDALLQVGWRSVHFARVEQLDAPIADPEAELRAYVVALK